MRGGRTLDPTWLDSAAGWLAEVVPSWRARPTREASSRAPSLSDTFGAEPDSRTYRLITSSRHLEAWLICWPRGGRLELHDHGGACGALRVVEGALSERYVPGPRLAARRRRLLAGQGISFDADYAHDVANQDGPTATSVHVYSAAVRPMAYYRLDDTGMLVPAGHVDESVVLEPDRIIGRESLARGGHPAGSGRVAAPSR